MKFTLGRLVATNGVAELMNSNGDFREFVSGSLKKYVECDWGDMCKDDSVMNDNAVKSIKGRIHGSYIQGAWKIWIITEWDRSVTTILFPSEY